MLDVGVGVGVTTGRPEPQPEAEEAVRAALKALDALLDVKWFPASVWCERTEHFEGRYAIICQWPQEDKRWLDYRAGLIGEPHDILGWLTDASGRLADWFEPGQAATPDIRALLPRVLEMLGRCDNTRQGWATRMKEAVAGNAAQQQAVKDAAAEEMLEHMAYHQKRLLGEPTVALGTGRSSEFDPRMRKTGAKHRHKVLD